MRLIDADGIKFEEDCTFSGKMLNEFIKAIPIAYDVDRVVERLKEAQDKECSGTVPKIRMCDAIEIVKSGMRE